MASDVIGRGVTQAQLDFAKQKVADYMCLTPVEIDTILYQELVTPSIAAKMVACNFSQGGYGGSSIGTRAGGQNVPAVASAVVYPNPFKRQTTVTLSLPEARPVTVKIYDGVMRPVGVLADGIDFSAGRHELEWNASHAAPGLYLISIEAGSFRQTFKIVKID